MSKTNKLAARPRLDPLGVDKDISAADLVDRTFLAYNGGRLREAARLLAEKMLPNDGFIGMSLTGALTPAGPGKKGPHPRLRGRFVGWVASPRANPLPDLPHRPPLVL